MQCLDEIVLKEQRFGFRAGDGHLYRSNLRYQRLHFRMHVRGHEVATHTIAQTLGLAHVEQQAVGREHPIDTRSPRQARHETTGIETAHRDKASARCNTARNISPVRRRVWVL